MRIISGGKNKGAMCVVHLKSFTQRANTEFNFLPPITKSKMANFRTHFYTDISLIGNILQLFQLPTVFANNCAVIQRRQVNHHRSDPKLNSNLNCSAFQLIQCNACFLKFIKTTGQFVSHITFASKTERRSDYQYDWGSHTE